MSETFELWKQLSSMDVIVGGRIVDESMVQLKSSQRNVATGKRAKHVRYVLVNNNNPTSSSSSSSSSIVTTPSSNCDASIVATAFDGQNEARLRQESADDSKTFLEIWRQNRLHSCFEVLDGDAKSLHGKVYASSSMFGGFSWSPNGKRLVYVAERKRAKSVAFGAKSKDGDDEVVRGRQHVFAEDWGEQLNDVSMPTLVVVDLDAQSAKLVPLDDNVCAGDPSFVDDERIVCVGYDAGLRRMGIIYCSNRPSAVYLVDADAGAAAVVEASRGYGVRSPRVSPDGSFVVFLQATSRGPHRSCDRLCRIDCSTQAVQVIVDTVAGTDDAFPGLYMPSLARRCFIDSGTLVLASQWRSTVALLRINLGDGTHERVDPLSSSASLSSFSLVDVDAASQRVLAIESSCRTPGIAHLASIDGAGALQWRAISSCRAPPPLLSSIDTSLIQLRAADTNEPFEAVLWRATSDNDSNNDDDDERSLLAYPHGGPHSAFDSGFYLSFAALTLSGYDVLLINYRGSLGFGQASIDSLPGRIGTNDVADCVAATRAASALRQYKSMGVIGGSHGGFLSAHLIGQHPTLFGAAVLRNPVINLSTMVGTSDIRDWVFVEACGSDAVDAIVQSEQQVAQMFRASPIAHVRNVRSPCLLVLGSRDRRVPNSQGFEFYYALRHLQPQLDVELFVYDDPHAITQVAFEMDAFINAIQFFNRHLK
jgi:acylaminoacyl-peptidase